MTKKNESMDVKSVSEIEKNDSPVTKYKEKIKNLNPKTKKIIFVSICILLIAFFIYITIDNSYNKTDQTLYCTKVSTYAAYVSTEKFILTYSKKQLLTVSRRTDNEFDSVYAIMYTSEVSDVIESLSTKYSLEKSLYGTSYSCNISKCYSSNYVSRSYSDYFVSNAKSISSRVNSKIGDLILDVENIESTMEILEADDYSCKIS